jgi:serine/threonine-protein kinase RsbT
MAIVSRAVLPIRSPGDIVRVRQAARENAVAQGFTLIDQTKLVTAASELARNTLDHGGGGEVEITRL